MNRFVVFSIPFHWIILWDQPAEKNAYNDLFIVFRMWLHFWPVINLQKHIFYGGM